jgi:tetratricopeptide (TPR) repeat protein
LVDLPLKVPAPRPWPRAEKVDSYWTHERWRRRLQVLAITIVSVALIAAGFGALVLKARANYIAGQRALAAGQYGVAIDRFNAAQVAGRPYADARTLLSDALSLSNLQAEYFTTLHDASRPTAATLTMRHAAALFQSGRYTQAQALLSGLHSRVPPAVMTRLSTVGDSAVAAVLLLAGANQAFAAGAWTVAAQDAADVLVRYPRCGPATALAAEAARRARAQPLALRAAALAAAGHWKAALKVVRQTLRIDPAYPGATALLARIDAALASRRAAAKAKAAASRAAAAAAAAAATTSTSVTTRPAPTPPPP